MVHAPHIRDMSAVYRARVKDERLIRVSEFMRSWLFGGKAQLAIVG
jgi:hypothetical protein